MFPNSKDPDPIPKMLKRTTVIGTGPFDQYSTDCKKIIWSTVNTWENSNKPPRDKTNKMACAPSEDSDQSLHCPHEESLGP